MISSFPSSSSPSVALEPPASGVRILAIDGGGMRGIIALEFLKIIEKRLKQPIWRFFDLICGTSAGGIIALALATSRLSAEKAQAFFISFGKKIFDRNALIQISSLSAENELFSSDALESALKKQFGNSKLTNYIAPRVFVTATNCNQHQPAEFLFRNYSHDNDFYEGTTNAQVWQASRSTSAAPLYFVPFKFECEKDQKYLLKDGGMMANNPVKIGYFEARNIWKNKRINFILSLGTGYFEGEENPATNDNPSISKEISGIIKELTKIVTNSQRIHEEFVEEIKVNKYDFDYFRLNITLGDPIALSEINPKILEAMQKLVQEYCNNNAQMIDTIVNKILNSV